MGCAGHYPSCYGRIHDTPLRQVVSKICGIDRGCGLGEVEVVVLLPCVVLLALVAHGVPLVAGVAGFGFVGFGRGFACGFACAGHDLLLKEDGKGSGDDNADCESGKGCRKHFVIGHDYISRAAVDKSVDNLCVRRVCLWKGCG